MKKAYNDLEIDEIDEVSGVDNPAQVGARAVIFKRAQGLADPGRDAVGSCNDTGQGTSTDMDPKQLEQELAKVQADLARTVAELNVAKALGALSDGEKAIHKSLGAAGQESFLELAPAERAARVAAAQESNAIVYTDLVGNVFRKNDDPRMIAMAKGRDEDRTALLAERSIRQAAEFAKRADSELNHLPGDATVKVSLLKSVAGISDQATRDGVTALLKAANDAMALPLAERGDSRGPDGDQSASGKLEKMASDLAAAHKVDINKGYELACATPAGRQLYAEMNAPKR